MHAPVPAHATRDRPTASGVKLPCPGLATPHAYTTLIRVKVITTSQPNSWECVIFGDTTVESKQPVQQGDKAAYHMLHGMLSTATHLLLAMQLLCSTGIWHMRDHHQAVGLDC